MPKVYAIQSNIVWEDQPANHQSVVALLTQTAPHPGSLVILPELFDLGFTMNVANLPENTGPFSESWSAQTARRFKIFLQAASIHREPAPDLQITNNAIVYNPQGELICRYKKIFPFGEESQHYTKGHQLSTFDWQGFKVCPLICYDLRFPELWRLATVDLGAELFTCGASWPDPRQNHWTTLLQARAIENLAYVIGVNRCGTDPNLNYAGGSLILDPQGKTLAEAGSNVEVITAEVNTNIVRDWRANFKALEDVRRELLGHLEHHNPND